MVNYLEAKLRLDNPRIPIVIGEGKQREVAGLLRFVQMKGRIRLGKGNETQIFEGTVCGVELVVNRDKWQDFKDKKISKTDRAFHFRLTVLTPEQLFRLGWRLIQMAQLLTLQNCGLKPSVEIVTAKEERRGAGHREGVTYGYRGSVKGAPSRCK